MNYKQISDKELLLIEHLFNNYFISIREISKQLNRSPSTIARIIKSGMEENKFSSKKCIENRLKRNHHKYDFKHKKYSDFLNFLYNNFDKRKNGISLIWWESKYIQKIDTPSLATIYNWIKNNKINIKRYHLTHSKYKKGGKRKGGEFGSTYRSKWVLPIGMRPNFINERKIFGNWEGDLIIGKNRRGPHLLTIVERMSRKGFIFKVDSKNEWKMPWLLIELKNKNNWYMYSLAIDNGIEFNRIGIFAKKCNVKIFKCEPYCSYQKGSNENFNKLVRRYYPKSTDFTNITQEELYKVQEEINNKPRKIFKMKTANTIHKFCKEYLQKDSKPNLNISLNGVKEFFEILEFSRKIYKKKKKQK